MRVEMSCLGDKIRLFSAIDNMIKRKEEFDFSISNAIPKYALTTYKYMWKVATEVRHQNVNLKTSGDHARGHLANNLHLHEEQKGIQED